MVESRYWCTTVVFRGYRPGTASAGASLRAAEPRSRHLPTPRRRARAYRSRVSGLMGSSRPVTGSETATVMEKVGGASVLMAVRWRRGVGVHAARLRTTAAEQGLQRALASTDNSYSGLTAMMTRSADHAECRRPVAGARVAFWVRLTCGSATARLYRSAAISRRQSSGMPLWCASASACGAGRSTRVGCCPRTRSGGSTWARSSTGSRRGRAGAFMGARRTRWPSSREAEGRDHGGGAGPALAVGGAGGALRLPPQHLDEHRHRFRVARLRQPRPNCVSSDVTRGLGAVIQPDLSAWTGA